MNLFYFTRSRLPNRRAHCIQIFNTCAGFAENGADTRLIASLFKLKRGTEAKPGAWPGKPEDYVGVKQNFTLVRTPEMLWQRLFGSSRREVMVSAGAKYIKNHSDGRSAVFTRSSELTLRMARYGFPVALEVHDEDWLNGDHMKELMKEFPPTAPNSFLGIVSISRTLADMLVRGGVPEEAIGIAHDGIDIARFDPSPVDGASRFATLSEAPNASTWLEGVSPDLMAAGRPVIGYCGHFYEGRGIGMLVDCAARRPDWTFLLIGGLEEDVNLYRKAAAERSLKNIIFTGFLPNPKLPGLLRLCDVLAMPYEYTTAGSFFMSPMKMFEYMAAGRAIVTADWPQIREVLDDGVNALLHPRGDVDALEKALDRVCSDPAFRQQLADRARETVLNYTWKERARRILEWLESRMDTKKL